MYHIVLLDRSEGKYVWFSFLEIKRAVSISLVPWSSGWKAIAHAAQPLVMLAFWVTCYLHLDQYCMAAAAVASNQLREGNGSLPQ